MTAAAQRPSSHPTAQRRQWDKALARAWPDGDLSSLLFFERTLPYRRKQALQTIFDGQAIVDRLHAVLATPPAALPAHVALTTAPTHRDLPVDFEGELVLVIREGASTLCATVHDGELRALLLDGPLPFSDRRVHYRPRSELESAEALAAACAPDDQRFVRRPASRLDDRFSCPPDLEGGVLLATVLDALTSGGTGRTRIGHTFSACRDAEAALVATWTVRRAFIDLLRGAARLTRRTNDARLTLDGLVIEDDGDVLRLSSSVTGAVITAPTFFLDDGVLHLTAHSWDGREHVLTVDRGHPVGPLPPLDALLDLAVELDDLEAQLHAIT